MPLYSAPSSLSQEVGVIRLASNCISFKVSIFVCSVCVWLINLL